MSGRCQRNGLTRCARVHVSVAMHPHGVAGWPLALLLGEQVAKGAVPVALAHVLIERLHAKRLHQAMQRAERVAV